MRLGLRTLALCVWFTGSAWAQDDAAIAQARDSYDRGAAAYDAKDYARAAAELARADELVPNATVLELALQAAVRAHDAPTAMELVERVEKRVPESAPLYAHARAARSKLARDAATITPVCPAPVVFCTATIDGRLAPIAGRRWVRPGEHAVEMTADGAPEKQTVTVTAGGSVEVKPTPAPTKPPAPVAAPAPTPAAAPVVHKEMAAGPAPSQRRDSGLTPVWFWVGTAVTVGVGAATVWSGLDTQSKHDAFAAHPTLETQGDGRDAQLRTNILGVVAAACGVTTAALGIFAVSWGKGPTTTVGGRF
jgi:hypothetical protein